MSDLLTRIVEIVNALLPTLITVAVVFGIITIVRLILDRKFPGTSSSRFRIQMSLLLLSFAGGLAIIMALPITENTRGQLLSLIGILLSAAIALSATTFVGNMMAGMMLRAVRSFKLGDFIQSGDNFGRVTERGLFHIEIQTEDRNLTSIPNLYLITTPVRVVRSSGTMVTADISLGYDVPHSKISELLCKAASDAGLEEPFAHVVELGNYSVSYKVSGLLTEVKHLLSARSRLRESMLDSLHKAKIEIVSPTFMNTRAYNPKDAFIAPVSRVDKVVSEIEKAESLVFDKADEAESIGRLNEKLREIGDKLKATNKERDKAEDEGERDRLQSEIDRLKNREEWLVQIINRRESEERQ
ncbi:MAG: mechanosensitive ion channel [bacterium]|nr:mechanosensitive ion channel [bacterium]